MLFTYEQSVSERMLGGIRYRLLFYFMGRRYCKFVIYFAVSVAGVYVLVAVSQAMLVICRDIEMEAYMEFELGQIVKLKKKHPCGSFEWEILRVGADFRLKCLGCGHQVMISRRTVEKNCKGVREKE